MIGSRFRATLVAARPLPASSARASATSSARFSRVPLKRFWWPPVARTPTSWSSWDSRRPDSWAAPTVASASVTSPTTRRKRTAAAAPARRTRPRREMCSGDACRIDDRASRQRRSAGSPRIDGSRHRDVAFGPALVVLVLPVGLCPRGDWSRFPGTTTKPGPVSPDEESPLSGSGAGAREAPGAGVEVGEAPESGAGPGAGPETTGGGAEAGGEGFGDGDGAGDGDGDGVVDDRAGRSNSGST
jgi:hypothetical protein